MLLFKITGARSIAPASIAAFFAVILSLAQNNIKLSGYFWAKSGETRHYFNNSLFILILMIQLSVFIIIPYVFSILTSKKISLAKAIYYPVLTVFSVIFVLVISYLYLNKIDVNSLLNFYSNAILKNMMGVYKQVGVAYLTTAKMRQVISKLLMDALLLLPSIVIALSWTGLWFSFIILRKFYKGKPSIFFKNNENLSLWKSSDFLILFLLSGIIVAIFSNGIYKFIGYNIIFLSSSVYLVQGLTIISFLLNKLNLNLFLKILAYILIILFNNPLMIFVIFMGIFDTWFNFRKITLNKKGGL
ncbi:MAG: YybS family protein [Deltaproteobacteria bacterium]|nr:YybS family protein [Deltaproteobacteria bacterium]